LWFAPALLIAWFSETRSLPVMFGSLAVGVVAYAALALLNADRQFVHDAICRTRLISTAPPKPA
jgi:ABC-type transport system involved in cytochrome c biogenesis permease subunit